MATQPITGEVRAFPAAPPMPAVARILSRFDRPALEGFIAVAIELIDTLDGEADTEDDDPPEIDDDPEQDDPGEDDDPAEDSDPDYCLASEDRGTGGYMSPALFNGYAHSAAIREIDGLERSLQPVTLNPA